MSPFDLDDAAAYARWRDAKLAGHPGSVGELLVELDDPTAPGTSERTALAERLGRCNMAVFSAPWALLDRDGVRRLGAQVGLHRLDQHLCAGEDAVSALTVADDALHAGYIPYTHRPIAWHTDGYYNPPEHQIRGLLLYCVRPAREGGTNQLLDHEIAYLLLRDRDPALVRALMHPAAMCIPPNRVDGEELRPEVCGPVFSVDAAGHLHMRYTARRRNIRWRDDPATHAAVAALAEILAGPSPWHFDYRLAAGQGLICNNVLHTRSGFEADSARLLYRARYYDRVALGAL